MRSLVTDFQAFNMLNDLSSSIQTFTPNYTPKHKGRIPKNPVLVDYVIKGSYPQGLNKPSLGSELIDGYIH